MSQPSPRAGGWQLLEETGRTAHYLGKESLFFLVLYCILTFFFFLLLSMAVREVLSSFGYGSPQCLAPSGSCKWQSGCVDLAHVNVLYLLRENICCVSQA